MIAYCTATVTDTCQMISLLHRLCHDRAQGGPGDASACIRVQILFCAAHDETRSMREDEEGARTRTVHRGEQPEKKMMMMMPRRRTPEEDKDEEQEEEEQALTLLMAQLSTSSTSSTPPPAPSMNRVQAGLQLSAPLIQLRHISSSLTLLGWRWRSLGI